jgi:hypothetical protein
MLTRSTWSLEGVREGGEGKGKEGEGGEGGREEGREREAGRGRREEAS